MLRDHHDPPVGAAVDGMAPLGAHLGEPGGFQRTGHLADRQVRQSRAHAAPGSRNEVTRGVLVTCRAGSSTSSRYSPTASARLASASSIVWPWLATSTSRHCATYQSSSRCTAAVRV